MVAKNVPRCLLERMESNALITSVDVIVVSDFVAVQHCTTAAATVFHGTQFGFLKNNNCK